MKEFNVTVDAKGLVPTRLTVLDTEVSGLKIIERQQLGDSRGYFERLFCADELEVAGWRKSIAQINHTLTHKLGTVRGMHFQLSPHAEMKLVTCLRGAVWDVVVDLRAGSSTFLDWHATELTAQNRFALLIPEGFAHGFQTLSDDCELLYFHSKVYIPESEAGIHPSDCMLSITWPLDITEMSVKDSQLPMLDHYIREDLV